MNYYPGEKSIKSGHLYKKGKINKRWQRRWCILSRDSKLFYHKQANEKHSGFVDLRQCIIKQSECTEKENIFEINTSNRIFLFSAESKTEMEEWMKSIYTHSKVQQENDLIERSEYIIRDQSLYKSSLEDEFLKLKHSFNPYIFQQQNQQTQTSSSSSPSSSYADEFLNNINYSIPTSLLSFNYYNSDNSITSSPPPPTLSSYIPISTKSLYNHFNAIGNHEYNHPLDLIISTTTTQSSSSTIINNNSNNTPIPSPPYGSPSSNRIRTPNVLSSSFSSSSSPSMIEQLSNTDTSPILTTPNPNIDSNNNNSSNNKDKATPTRRFSFFYK